MSHETYYTKFHLAFHFRPQAAIIPSLPFSLHARRQSLLQSPCPHHRTFSLRQPRTSQLSNFVPMQSPPQGPVPAEFRKGLSPPSSLLIMVTVHPLPSTFAVPVRFPRLQGLTNGKCALSRATLRRRQGVLSRMTSSCLSGTDRLSADAVAVSRHGQFAPDGNPVRQPTQAASASPSGRRGSGGSTGSRPAESSSAAPTPPAAETPGRARRRRR